MSRKAVLKKDLGELKQGTVLHFSNGVFAHKKHTFFPEDVYFDEVHFEVIEINPVKSVSEIDTDISANPFDIFTTSAFVRMASN